METIPEQTRLHIPQPDSRPGEQPDFSRIAVPHAGTAERPDPMIDAREMHLSGPEAVARKVRGIVGDGPCYLTFDIDALDPAFAPGTGTPVWGGLSSGQAAIVLRDLAGINLVGGDVVEVSPPYDTTGATAVAGAHVAMELICLWGWTRRTG